MIFKIASVDSLVIYFGNVNPNITLKKLGNNMYRVWVTVPQNLENVNIKTKLAKSRHNF